MTLPSTNRTPPATRTRTHIQESDRIQLPIPSISYPSTMIDTSSLPKAAPPSYDASQSSPEPSTSNNTRTTNELTQQRNIHIPAQKGRPVTLSPMPAVPNPVQPEPTPYPSVVLPQDAATIGARYQAELFALCARGEHQPTRKYGPCGIITAVFLFPVGLICLFTNSERLCSRCGIRLNGKQK